MNTLKFNDSNDKIAVNFSGKIVAHEDFNLAQIKINQVHCSRTSGATGLLITGTPGVGKTTLSEEYKSHFEVPDSEERNITKVLTVETPDSKSAPAFYSAILRALKDPVPDKGTVENKETRILTQLKEQQVELIIFDEIHNILPKKMNGEKAASIANKIKTLMNLSKLSIVLMGEPEAIGLPTYHKAMASRFQNTLELKPMAVKPKKAFEDLKSYLAELQGFIDLETINMSSDDFAIRMFAATGGIPREIRKIIVSAIDYREDPTKLTLSDFWLGCNTSSSNPLKIKGNPFSKSIKTVKKDVGL